MVRDDKNWRILEKTRVFEASPYVAVDVEKVELPDGRVIKDYYHVDLPDFCVGVPILEDGTILTQWQYKHGAGCTSLTFPAGQIDPGEDPEHTMVRELREETGFVAEKIRFLGAYCVNGNQGCAMAHMFALEGCRQFSEPDHDDLEVWDIRFMTVAQIETARREGHFAILPHLAVWLAFRS